MQLLSLPSNKHNGSVLRLDIALAKDAAYGGAHRRFCVLAALPSYKWKD
jgi:hypothetical protein